jgi:hypothetical protein
MPELQLSQQLWSAPAAVARMPLLAWDVRVLAFLFHSILTYNENMATLLPFKPPDTSGSAALSVLLAMTHLFVGHC